MNSIIKYFTIGWLHDNLFVGINGILFFPILFLMTLYFVLKHENKKNILKHEIKEALTFSKNLLIENFITPNRLRLPLSRNILEKYYN